ncbi:hypothetical protein EDC18_1055 [Natranaerovirga pectinivora]|uniref:Uncharacterized protein n=1 Tax=Natranaerovirga pectinivora TaxID=682400 RepID=A0A4R3MNY3_9FIRM|nr:hypothetical protein [Natranaerovirga pectinivora]TCT14524.1 hypothetical protein EDC18_1055 [Natranaerovirga pectinivora]
MDSDYNMNFECFVPPLFETKVYTLKELEFKSLGAGKIIFQKNKNEIIIKHGIVYPSLSFMVKGKRKTYFDGNSIFKSDIEFFLRFKNVEEYNALMKNFVNLLD